MMLGLEDYVEFFLLPAIFLSVFGRTSGVHEFQAFRMQQFDLHGSPHGHAGIISLDSTMTDVFL